MATANVTERNSQGLINAMFEELDLLRTGKSTPQMASAKAKITNTIISVKRLEMDAIRFIASGQKKRKIELVPFSR